MERVLNAPSPSIAPGKPTERHYTVNPSAKVMAALRECTRAIGRNAEKQREFYLYLRERFLMAAEEGVTKYQTAKLVGNGCSPHMVSITLLWDPAKANTPYAGHYAKRMARGGQYPTERRALVLKLTDGRIKLDLATWTAATKLVTLDVDNLTTTQRAEAIDAAAALIGRLNTKLQ